MMESPVSSDNNDLNGEDGEWPQSLYDFQRNIRAPKGFFGMRGKKDFTNAEKRALMGIQQVCVCVCLFACISEFILLCLLFRFRILMDYVVERDLLKRNSRATMKI